MGVLVDFHTHILPCMDDGSDSVSRSLEMLALEKEQGVDTVILTPHFYPDNERPERFLERRAASQRLLIDALRGRSDLPELLFGAEVRYFEGISDCEYLPQLAIGDTGYVMIEMPMMKWSQRMLDELCGVSQKQSLTPIIAHIDRYVGTLRSCVDAGELAELPLLIQASAEFFIGHSTRRRAIKMLERGFIHLLGSDAHNMSSRRPNLENAFAVIKHSLGDEAIAYINSFENAVLCGENHEENF